MASNAKYIDYDPDEEEEKLRKEERLRAEYIILKDAVNASFSSYIISLDTSKYTKGPKFDGKNIDFMFEIIKHYVGFMFATILRTATSMKIPVKLLDENIATVVRLLKRRGIFLTPVASADEDKITPKLIIKDGELFIKDLLQKTMNMAPSIDEDLAKKRDEVIRHLEEEKRSFANAQAKANAAAASLLAEEKAKSNNKLTKKQKKKPGAGAGAPNAAANLARMAKEVARNAEAAAERNYKSALLESKNALFKGKAPRSRVSNLVTGNAAYVPPAPVPLVAATGPANSVRAGVGAADSVVGDANSVRAGAGAANSVVGAAKAAKIAPPSMTADPGVQDTIQTIMTQIHRIVYSPTVVANLKHLLPADFAGTPDLLVKNVVKLYFHGGNSVALMTGQPFPSDFDMNLLVNPNLEPAKFKQVRTIIIEEIIKALPSLFSTKGLTDNIVRYYKTQGYNDGQYNMYKNIFLIKSTVADPEDSDLVAMYERLKTYTFANPIPVGVQVYPAFFYRDNIGKEITLKMGSIKILSTEKGRRLTELFNLTYPSQNNELLRILWGFMNLTPIATAKYMFYVPTPVSLYLEQQLALRGTPADPHFNSKRRTRSMRVETMKRIVRDKRSRFDPITLENINYITTNPELAEKFGQNITNLNRV